MVSSGEAKCPGYQLNLVPIHLVAREQIKGTVMIVESRKPKSMSQAVSSATHTTTLLHGKDLGCLHSDQCRCVLIVENLEQM